MAVELLVPISGGEKGVGDAVLCSKQGGIRQVWCTVCPRNSSYYKLAQPKCENAQIVEAAGQSWQQSFTHLCIS